MTLLKVAEVAEMTQVPTGTLYRWSAGWPEAKVGPRPIKLGRRHLRYDAEEVQAWITSCAQQSA